jgi:quinolinate synthase
MTRDLQKKIIELKKEKDAVILAHSYQSRAVTEIADVVGDSFQLSQMATKYPQKNLILCGVHFMAETAKMLSPEKRVFLPNPQAGCPMAEQLEPEMLAYLKAQEPDRTVVAYINTTAKLKELCDVCVTSSSAVKIVKRIKNDKILFIPDCNLGDYVRRQVPEKDFKLVQGGCPVHAAVTLEDFKKAKELHPNALVLVHPECIPAIVERADYVGSTTGIMEYAKKSDHDEFIIGTEMSIAEHLQYDCPDKSFYILSKKILCPNMKITTLPDVYRTLVNLDQDNGKAFEIIMTKEEIEKARKCIDEMLRLGE